jgi:VWFA-related protein
MKLRSHITIACFAIAALVGVPWPPARLAAAQEQPTPRFQGGSEVVVLDVVVRDKKGRTVRDLRPDEVSVLEDGVPQEVLTFRLRAAGSEDEPTGPEPETGAGTPVRRGEDARHVNLVTLVFDQLGVDGRNIARKAGLTLSALVDRPDLLVSVFTIRERLKLVQQFSTDRNLIDRAVKEATGELNTQHDQATSQVAEAVRHEAEAQDRFDSAAAVATAEQAALLARLGRDVDIARMAVDAVRLTDTLQREQQGRSSLYSLLALARQQQRLAGRKTILFFSEGVQVPPALEHVFRATISEANRANVSIYAVDARGLSDERDLEAVRESLRQASAAAQRQFMSRGLGPVTKEQIHSLDTAEAALRLDLQGTLADLATSTGGTLIANSNDVRPGIERAVGDLRGYYEVVYAPPVREYDGRFRRISVKVSRPGVSVQARSGYFAVPPGEGTATFAYEVDLLRALRVQPPPVDFETRSATFRFGPENGGTRHTTVVEVPLSAIEFQPDERGEVDRAHFSILAVLRDPTGAVVEKWSEDSPVFLPRQQRQALKQGNALFLRSFAAPPGRYTLETAVVDQLSRRYSVQRAVLEVPRPASGLAVSDVALIKRVEPVPAGALPSEDPFRQGTSRLVPWIEEPRVAQGDALSLFLVAYPRGVGQADVLVEFLREGKLVGQSLQELAPPSEDGRAASFVASVPMRDLLPGHYEVRVLVKQGGLVAHRKARFVLEGSASAPQS